MATVDRVLPWRRQATAPADEVAPVVAAYRARHPKASTSTITRAYEVAASAHAEQFRKSGERYINHPVAVARIVAELGLDETTVSAALLHDAVEDTAVTLEDVQREFGAEVASIVDGVTKLERIRFDSKEEQQAATMRKMLVAMAKDLRVLIIKLSDRLHNMRTIAAFPEHKQRRTAQETLDIYAPLAHRLGMQEMKQQLEDLAFASLHPKRYAEIDHMVSTRSPERDEYLDDVLEHVRTRLAELRITAEVTGRPKHLWSIYEKMVVKGREFDEIFDLVGIRVIVETVKDCYAALGSIHATWKPVQGRFKDYIAMPKFNLYQSLHTTVVGPGGKPLEVQIRTREMHQRSEFGVAAHWSYKENTPASDIAWLNRIVDWQQETSDPAQFMENLKTDLEQDEVFVFTPKGRVVTLPRHATPIDFAYSVHTEVGHSCIGARVNGRLVPLDSELQSGDTCEIFTSKVEGAGAVTRLAEARRVAEGPQQDPPVVLARAARGRDRDRSRGAREGDAPRGPPGPEARRQRHPREHGRGHELPEPRGALRRDRRQPCIRVGDRSARRSHPARGRGGDRGSPAVSVRTPRKSKRTDSTGIHVEGLDDVMVRLSRCCTPVPGDEIVGFVTRGRGVSVHRADCANALSLSTGQSDRVIDVEWDGEADTVFVAAIEVKALDRSRLLRDVSNALSDQHVNIIACSTQTGNDRISRMRFEFELADPQHLDSVISTIRQIDSVYDAYRILPGKGR